ncbi:hypothetical protein HYS84_02855 [Candidatus Saccharibacteria bacterium]|nr:hypothetical protein [Candidatus Saccharibacteria bacterium]
MDSLRKILGSRKIAQAPNEIKQIQDYVQRRYNSSCRVKVQRGALIINVPNSGLAATLHLERQLMIDKLKITDKLVIRTGR